MNQEDLNITVERNDNCTVEFSVEIPPDEVENERKQAINELKQEIDVPGFRKGKVPVSIIEKKHPQRVKQELLERLVPQACQVVYQRHDIRPIENPKIQDFDMDGGFHLQATVLEQPQVDVSQDDYYNLVLEKPDDQVTEEAVDEQIDNLLSTQSNLEPVPIARPVQEGDFVKIDFQGYDDGGTPVDNAEGEDQVIEIGSERFLPEIEEGLIGAEEGEQRRIQASFPDEFVDDELSGQTVDFEVTVNEIQEERKPDPDDEEFLNEMDVDSVEELREQIRNRLEDAGEQKEREQLAEQIYDQLLESYSISLPESMVEQEIDSMMEDYRRQVEAQDRDFETYLESQDMDEEELREESREEAKNRIRLTLIFHSIAEKEGIEVSDQEFQEHLNDMAGETGMEIDELEELPDEQLNSLRYQLRDDKILDHLIDKSSIETNSPAEESERENMAD